VAPDPDVGHDGILDDAILGDQESRAAYTHTEWPVDVVHLDCNLVGIAEQYERQVVFVAKALVAIRILGADTGNLQANGLNIIVDIANLASLPRAPRREVGG